MTIRAVAPLDGGAILPPELVAQQLRPDSDADALAIIALRDTAIDWVERRAQVSLHRRLWIATFHGFAEDGLWLGRGPVSEVTQVVYICRDGLACNAAGLWRLAGDRLVRAGSSRWPSTAYAPGAVEVMFEAGYANVAVEAPALRVAALLLLQHLYDGGNLKAVPPCVTDLCDIDRVPVAG